eukprot:m.43143 g.43143  ORF g.43143 m.43143 type:complete len:661 (-) comp10771_c0_seq1:595-2577(-)
MWTSKVTPASALPATSPGYVSANAGHAQPVMSQEAQERLARETDVFLSLGDIGDFPTEQPVESLLRSLEASTGEFHPPFSPYRRLYVLLVPFDTDKVQFFATAYGTVKVNKRDSAVPLSLSPQSTTQKVLVEVFSTQSDKEHTSGSTDMETPPPTTTPPTPRKAVPVKYLVDIRRSPSFQPIVMSRNPPTRPPTGVANASLPQSVLEEASTHRESRPGSSVGRALRVEVAQHPFLSHLPEELSFSAGDRLVILGEDEQSGWLYGHKQFQPTTMGWFPASSMVHPSQAMQTNVVLSLDGGHGMPRQGLPMSSSAHSRARSQQLEPDVDHLATTQRQTSSGRKLLNSARFSLSSFEQFSPNMFVTIRQKSSKPSVTLVLMAIQIIVFIGFASAFGVAPMRVNPSLGCDGEDLRTLGVLWPPLLKQGHAYTLVTSLFIPVGLLRLIVDLTFMWLVCAPVERCHGHGIVALIFLGGGLCGNVLAAITTPRWLITGSSPGIFAVCGAVVGGMLVFKHDRAVWIKDLLFVIGFGFLSSLLGPLPGQSNWAQAGGFLCGCFLAPSLLAWLTAAQTNRHITAEDSRRQTVLSRGLVWRYPPGPQQDLSYGSLFVFALFVTIQFIGFYLFITPEAPCLWCMKATCFPVQDWCSPTTRLGIDSSSLPPLQ